MRRLLVALTLATTVRVSAQQPPKQPAAIPPLKPFSPPAWAIPSAPAPSPAPRPDSVVWHHIIGSPRAYTMRLVSNAFDIPDWFPDSHPAAPNSVMFGTRPNARACGYCHLPDGAGRPENGTLAGLPVEYAMAQMRAFRDSTRRSSAQHWQTGPMHAVAAAVTDEDALAAARYFAALPLTRRNRIVESTEVPKTRIETLLYAKTGDGNEPIAGRLIEVPDEFLRHELRDPTVRYTTYVPPGTLTRGRRLANTGPAGVATACATCHGADLLGMAGTPPIAGRNPANLLRQLVNFRTGMRADSAAVLMRAVVNPLTIDDMVALAAYVGSLPPHRNLRQRLAR